MTALIFRSNHLEKCHISTASSETWQCFLQTRYTEKRGFYLILKSRPTEDSAAETDMPVGFISLHCKSKKETHCTTHELLALNSRLQSASHDCLVLTYQVSIALRFTWKFARFCGCALSQ